MIRKRNEIMTGIGGKRNPATGVHSKVKVESTCPVGTFLSLPCSLSLASSSLTLTAVIMGTLTEHMRDPSSCVLISRH